MIIRLLGNNSGFKPSPERSVYSLLKDSTTQDYTFIVPLDIWFLENDKEGRVLDAGKRRKPPFSWKEIDLGLPGGNKGIAKPLGSPPNLLTGEVTPYIKCLAAPGFRPGGREQEEIESLSKLKTVPRTQVEPDMKVFIGKFRAEVVSTDVGFALDYLALSVSDFSTYQLRVSAKLGKSVIGEPVVTVQADGKKAIIGMLVGIQPRGNGGSDAWVLPAESII